MDPLEDILNKEIPRPKVNTEIDSETIKSFTAADVLPLFEKKSFDYTRVKHYSLKTNQFLSSKWKKFIDAYGGRERKPLQFPQYEDDHFVMCKAAYAPEMSQRGKDFHRRILTGSLDVVGDRPVADDQQVRKTKPRLRSKTRKRFKRRYFN